MTEGSSNDLLPK